VERISGPWGKKIPSLFLPQGLTLSGMDQDSEIFLRPGEPELLPLTEKQ